MLIKSPLRYPGGKAKGINSIAPLIPEFKEYREPLCGGCSVFYYVRQTYPNKIYWINDLFWELYNFWKNCQSNIEGIINQIYQWKNQFTDGKQLFQFLKFDWYRFNELEKAAAFFVLSRITFGGGILSTGYSEIQFQGRFTESAIKELSDAGHLLQNAKITNLDYKKVVEAPSADGIDDKDVWLFLDPPYYAATESGLYGRSDKWRNLHKTFDHYRFIKTMKHITDTTDYKWLITYDDSQFVRKQFEWANLIPWNLIYGLRTKNSNIGKELFVTNYELPKNKQKTIDDAWRIEVVQQ